MFKNIHLAIESESRVQFNSVAIYKDSQNENINFNPREVFIDYTKLFDPQYLQVDHEIFYILFNGKKVKQEIARPKTLLTIKKIKLPYDFSHFLANQTFVINDTTYPLVAVKNLIPCDLLYAEGGIFDANEIHSAVFFPYFMENREAEGKSTLIFINIMFERFKIISKKIFETLSFSLVIDDEVINLHTIDKEDVAMWITLHEYAHNSGPLSLFTSNANKFSTKKYGFIEELRVDLTSIKILLESFHCINQNYKKIIALIILERFFRGALYNYQETWDVKSNEMFAKEVEGDVSIALMILFQKYHFINFDKKLINFSKDQMKNLLADVLSDIYKFEEIALQKQAFSMIASKFASFFRTKYLQPTLCVTNFLKMYSLKNCQYTLSFINN